MVYFFNLPIIKQAEIAIVNNDPKLLQIILGASNLKLAEYLLTRATMNYNMLRIAYNAQYSSIFDVINKRIEITKKYQNEIDSYYKRIDLIEQNQYISNQQFTSLNNNSRHTQEIKIILNNFSINNSNIDSSSSKEITNLSKELDKIERNISEKLWGRVQKIVTKEKKYLQNLINKKIKDIRNDFYNSEEVLNKENISSSGLVFFDYANVKEIVTFDTKQMKATDKKLSEANKAYLQIDYSEQEKKEALESKNKIEDKEFSTSFLKKLFKTIGKNEFVIKDNETATQYLERLTKKIEIIQNDGELLLTKINETAVVIDKLIDSLNTKSLPNNLNKIEVILIEALAKDYVFQHYNDKDHFFEFIKDAEDKKLYTLDIKFTSDGPDNESFRSSSNSLSSNYSNRFLDSDSYNSYSSSSLNYNVNTFSNNNSNLASDSIYNKPKLVEEELIYNPNHKAISANVLDALMKCALGCKEINPDILRVLIVNGASLQKISKEFHDSNSIAKVLKGINGNEELSSLSNNSIFYTMHKVCESLFTFNISDELIGLSEVFFSLPYNLPNFTTITGQKYGIIPGYIDQEGGHSPYTTKVISAIGSEAGRNLSEKIGGTKDKIETTHAKAQENEKNKRIRMEKRIAYQKEISENGFGNTIKRIWDSLLVNPRRANLDPIDIEQFYIEDSRELYNAIEIVYIAIASGDDKVLIDYANKLDARNNNKDHEAFKTLKEIFINLKKEFDRDSNRRFWFVGGIDFSKFDKKFKALKIEDKATKQIRLDSTEEWSERSNQETVAREEKIKESENVGYNNTDNNLKNAIDAGAASERKAEQAIAARLKSIKNLINKNKYDLDDLNEENDLTDEARQELSHYIKETSIPNNILQNAQLPQASHAYGIN